MRLGIFGLPQSGKTTLFNALTHGEQPIGEMSGKIEVHMGVVDVPDPRLDNLSELFHPKKNTYAKVTYADIAGLDGNAGKSGISGILINELSQMDGFIHVVRCFVDESIPHTFNTVDPQRDIEAMDSDFIINDLISVERKLERLSEEFRRGAGRDKSIVQKEITLFERIHETLSNEIPLRDIEISDEEKSVLSGFGMLSQKPMLVVLNLDEGQEAPEINYDHQNTIIVSLQCKLEMEISQLPEDESELFLEEYGIEEPSLNRMIRFSYDLLGLQSFFTAGEKEVRAWTIKKGATAPEAAGVIHSDLQKGFIRAEAITYEELMELGSLVEAKNKGKLRLEGKKHIVQDGEVLTIRFNL
ncbi:MAG: redox-regulated ATPase YchF [Anaerolineaceae bacterium]|nr:redox-regulated ATPase YchF [Anaerolineaceae bacterium]